MKELETQDDIINEAKLFVEDLEKTYNLGFSGTRKGKHREYFHVGDDRIEISFATGRPVDNNECSFQRVSEISYVSYVHEDGAKEYTVLMTEEQFKELFIKHFGDMEANFFNQWTTWGVEIPLKAKKPIRLMWRYSPRDLPDEVYVLRETPKMLFWTDDMKDGLVYPSRKSEVVGVFLFETEADALNALRAKISQEAAVLEREIKSKQATLSYLRALDKQAERAQKA